MSDTNQRSAYWPFASIDEVKEVLSTLYDKLDGEQANAVAIAHHALNYGAPLETLSSTRSNHESNPNR